MLVDDLIIVFLFIWLKIVELLCVC